MRWIPEKVAEILNRLAVVEWDRAITAPVETDDGEPHEMTIVYGWIPRDDGQRDYVQLDFPSWSDMPGFATSSALYSERMNRIIYGPDAPHYPCVKVAETPIGPLVERKARWAE